MNIKPLRHQNQFLSALRNYSTIRYFWFIGGYRSGKSYSLCQTILLLASIYNNTNAVFGLGAPTIALAKKTFILDLEIILNTSQTPYTYNKADNIIVINNVKFILIATGYPVEIYGYTFNGFLCDELDELPIHYGHEAFTAIDERCSKSLPDGRPPFVCFYSTSLILS